MNRKSITLLVVVVLCIVAFGFNKGWFSPSSPSTDAQTSEDSASQSSDADDARTIVTPATEEAAPPTSPPAE